MAAAWCRVSGGGRTVSVWGGRSRTKSSLRSSPVRSQSGVSASWPIPVFVTFRAAISLFTADELTARALESMAWTWVSALSIDSARVVQIRCNVRIQGEHSR